MLGETFFSKWKHISQGDTERENLEERSIFVDIGSEPATQRQLNLYNYFLFIKDVLEKMPHRPSVIEIGCGRGTIGLYLSKYMGLPVTLLDNVPEAIELAKEFFDAHGQRGVFCVGDVHVMPFPDQSFDAVVSIGLAEHFDEIDDLFKEEYRILKPGGVMISLNIPKKFSVQYLNVLMRFVKKMLGSYKGDVRQDYYRNNLKPYMYKEAAERAGFGGCAITHVYPFPFFIPVKMSTDRKLAGFFKAICRVRGIFMKYPWKTNRFVAQSHFLVGRK
jgi:ubiquinone/menaquinone biosynthesis C-methylase UbiE